MFARFVFYFILIRIMASTSTTPATVEIYPGNYNRNSASRPAVALGQINNSHLDHIIVANSGNVHKNNNSNQHRVIPIYEEPENIVDNMVYRLDLSDAKVNQYNIVQVKPMTILLLMEMLMKLAEFQKQIQFQTFSIDTDKIRNPIGINRNYIPAEPYLELLLSEHGKYLPKYYVGSKYHYYAHTTTNNLHNNQPIGSYKLVQERSD